MCPSLVVSKPNLGRKNVLRTSSAEYNKLSHRSRNTNTFCFHPHNQNQRMYCISERFCPRNMEMFLILAWTIFFLEPSIRWYLCSASVGRLRTVLFLISLCPSLDIMQGLSLMIACRGGSPLATNQHSQRSDGQIFSKEIAAGHTRESNDFFHFFSLESRLRLVGIFVYVAVSTRRLAYSLVCLYQLHRALG